MEFTLDIAKKIAEACEKKARQMGIPMVVAIVDAGGNAVLVERMDGAMLAGVQIAQDKAYTAAATGFDTHQIAQISQPGQIAYGLANTDRGRIVIFGGGIVLKQGQKTVGGVGASGGLANQDQEVAQAGADAFAKSEK
ncbi:MAG: heme-binding protein [Candidatus Wildermuthbacteria bacterium]|nr:heme-binding protein [Candidatus Wildermuthbacteria bacterium]